MPKFVLKSLLATALIIPVQQAASAQDGPAQTPGTWRVDAGDQYCSITRTTQDPIPVTFSIRIVPGHDFVELLMHSAQWSRPPLSEGQQAKIIALPEGVTYLQQARAGLLANRAPLLAFRRLPLDFLSTFTKSGEIQIERDGKTAVRFTYRQADRVLPAMRTCVSATLRDWGVDEALLNSLSRRPVAVRAWLTSNDYPHSALANDEAGQVVARLAIAASGRVTDCDVVSTSGHERLDEAVCVAARDRGRYMPALDAQGNPVAVKIIVAMTFEFMP
jgi:TonB family protein